MSERSNGMLVRGLFTHLPTSNHNYLIFNLDLDAGSVAVRYYPKDRCIDIWSVEVDEAHRRQGIGKLLVTYAMALAMELDAAYATARVTSRESLEMFRSLYGDDSLTIQDLGGFQDKQAPCGRTEAIFRYDIADLSDMDITTPVSVQSSPLQQR